MVSWCSDAVGENYTDYRNYSIEYIFMAHGDYETQLELDIPRDTGVGGDLNDENSKKGWYMSLQAVTAQRGKEEYMGRRGIPGDKRTLMMKKP